MVSENKIEIGVGLFLSLAIVALLVLAFKVSGLTSFFKAKSFAVTAMFDDIGQLKIRSPIKIGGVQIGEVSQIELDPVQFKARVTLSINSKFKEIPSDSSAAILTAGLLGDNYIALTPLYSEAFLKDKDEIKETHSAIIFEKLIGQLMYKLSSSKQHPETSMQTEEKK